MSELTRLSTTVRRALGDPLWMAGCGAVHLAFKDGGDPWAEAWCGLRLPPGGECGLRRAAVDFAGRLPDCPECRRAFDAARREVAAVVVACGRGVVGGRA
jgi:hypothetical protein